MRALLVPCMKPLNDSRYVLPSKAGGTLPIRGDATPYLGCPGPCSAPPPRGCQPWQVMLTISDALLGKLLEQSTLAPWRARSALGPKTLSTASRSFRCRRRLGPQDDEGSDVEHYKCWPTRTFTQIIRHVLAHAKTSRSNHEDHGGGGEPSSVSPSLRT